jgi:hypothetical protein
MLMIGSGGISLFVIALIITLLTVTFGGYFGWFGAPWRSPAYGGGLLLIVTVLVVLLVLGGP